MLTELGTTSSLSNELSAVITTSNDVVLPLALTSCYWEPIEELAKVAETDELNTEEKSGMKTMPGPFLHSWAESMVEMANDARRTDDVRTVEEAVSSLRSDSLPVQENATAIVKCLYKYTDGTSVVSDPGMLEAMPTAKAIVRNHANERHEDKLDRECISLFDAARVIPKAMNVVSCASAVTANMNRASGSGMSLLKISVRCFTSFVY